MTDDEKRATAEPSAVVTDANETGTRAATRRDIARGELTNNLNGISDGGVHCRVTFDRKLRLSDMKAILDIVMAEVDRRLYEP